MIEHDSLGSDEAGERRTNETEMDRKYGSGFNTPIHGESGHERFARRRRSILRVTKWLNFSVQIILNSVPHRLPKLP